MGPWTNTASSWFDYRIPLIGTERAHSIVVKPKQPTTACALFSKHTNNAGTVLYVHQTFGVSHPMGIDMSEQLRLKQCGKLNRYIKVNLNFYLCQKSAVQCNLQFLSRLVSCFG